MENNALALRAINAIRFLSVDAVQKAKSGHPGTPMGLAPLAYLLWTKYLRHNPSNPDWTGRDRFVLSCGHASMLLYSLLHLTGYDVTLDDLRAFRQWGSKTPGHPEAGHTPGVEVTTGPLGQGLGNAVGMAMASRMLAQRFNRPGHEIVSHRIVALCSDGDLMEGVASEAASLAGFHRLGNLVAFYDDNRITIEGSTDLAFREDAAGRFRAYGWNVLNVADGNTDLDGLSAAIEVAFAERERPTLVIVRTSIGFGSPNKQDTAEAHGAPLGEAEIALAKERLGWPATPAFLVPDDVLAHFREAVGARGEGGEGVADEVRRVHRRVPGARPRMGAADVGRSPRGMGGGDPDIFARGRRDRHAKRIAESVERDRGEGPGAGRRIGRPGALHGDDHEGRGGVPPRRRAGGRNIHFGVREHGMGAILNGMARHGGVIPYGATFFIFSDYMRPSIRLAALMGCRVIYVLTHDSVGVGEDGPTHQPIEHLASLRAMPNLHVVRPADANETAVAWRTALERTQGPTLIVLTRQKIPILPPERVLREDGAAAGRTSSRTPRAGPPEVLLLATGSEVSVALAARKLLAEEGISARVVSMPCWERFEAQEAWYRDSVLPPAVPARVSVEAGSTFGWERYVGDRGASVGIDRFGASAPAERIFRELGITPEGVRDRAKSVLAAMRGGVRR